VPNGLTATMRCAGEWTAALPAMKAHMGLLRRQYAGMI
jgi:hypothetical protein